MGIGRGHTGLMEHRWGKRFAVDLPVTVVHVMTNRVGDGCLQDISLGGALLRSPWELTIGARVQVQIVGSTDPGKDALIDARVVRRSGDAIAVEWFDFAPSDAIDLVRTQSGRRASPAALQR